jgi:replicative DNA helicase
MYEQNAEKIFLGAILLSGGAVLDDCHLIASDFSTDKHSKIFATMVQMRRDGEGIDTVTVGSKIPELSAYLHEATGETPTWQNANFYEQLIHDRNARWALVQVGHELQAAGNAIDSDVDVALDRAGDRIEQVTVGRLRSEVEFVKDLILPAVDNLNSAPDFVPSQWGKLNDFLGGFRPGALYIIGARPAVGKSVVAVNMAFQLAATGAVSFHSLEMSKREIVNRLFASVCMVSMDHIEQRKMTALDWERIAKGRELMSRPIAIADKSGQTLTDVRAFARQVSKKQKLAAIVVDYLQLMQDTERGRSRYESVTAISNGLKILARDLDVPVIALAQLNRAVEGRKDSAPNLSDLRDSGAIEQDADVVILLNRERALDDGEDDRSKMVLHIAKNRHGRTGHVALRFEGVFARVVENQ